ncbi:Alpha-(1,3)-fucosyltransferase 6, partial [Armadillidium nasatum]
LLLCFQDYGRSFAFGLGHEPFEAACCKEKRCFMTDDRNIIPLKEFDAILVHFRNIKKIKIPKERLRYQRWIFYEGESPLYSSKTPQYYEGFFNWTMTYRKDSDIVASYGKIYKKTDFAIEDLNSSENISYTLNFLMKTKNKMVSWFVSNCNTPSKRREYVWELQKFISVSSECLHF